MNFYKHYIGDYQRDTAHLSITEHGAYLLMLHQYYATGAPLTSDRKALCRMLRAESKGDRDAIDSVLKQYWRETPEGWVNDRAYIELERAEREAERNRENGRRGGRPRKPTGNPDETQKKPSGFSVGLPNETQKKGNHSHSHKSPPSLRSGGEARAKRLPPDWRPDEEEWRKAVVALGPELAARELEKFCNHWKSKTERRLDWGATWRNWVMKAEDYAKTRGNSGASRESAVERVRRATRQDGGSALATHGGDLRPQMDERLRGGPDGAVVEGDFRVVG